MTKLSALTSAQLKRAAEIQEQIEVLNGKLDAILDGDHFDETREAIPLKSKGKGKFSAATKAKMAAAQKARWAKIKNSKASKSGDVPEKKKRRTMSASAKAKIGAAQKARWAKLKAGK